MCLHIVADYAHSIAEVNSRDNCHFSHHPVTRLVRMHMWVNHSRDGYFSAKINYLVSRASIEPAFNSFNFSIDDSYVEFFIQLILRINNTPSYEEKIKRSHRSSTRGLGAHTLEVISASCYSSSANQPVVGVRAGL